jgi:acyl-CoA thioester hydrolase
MKMEKEVSSVVKIRFSDCDPIGHLNNVKYLEYMLNAREDHVEEFYGFTYEDYFRRTGCTWVAVQNEIAYLKEVKANTKVVISSKTIEMSDRVSKVEILMKDENEKEVFAVLWYLLLLLLNKQFHSELLPKYNLFF